jgi:hypothetical protein
MLVDRLRFYQRRQQRIFAEKFKAITTATPTNWKELSIRHKSLGEELEILQNLINTISQIDYCSRRKLVLLREWRKS